MSGESTVTIALLFPDLLGTYGDSGNALILAQRLRWRGIDCEVLTVRSGEAVPTGCALYVVGGGEDMPQSLAARQLGAGTGTGALNRAVESGAVVLAVCAGLQIIGTTFVGPDGLVTPGLGLLDCTTGHGRSQRAVGEVVVEAVSGLAIPTMTGYENHAGVTTLGPQCSPLGRVTHGRGNNDGSGFDGAWRGKVLGTYLHGPVLARNPALADLLLSWAVGPLEPLDDFESEALRRERLAAAGTSVVRDQAGRLRSRAGQLRDRTERLRSLTGRLSSSLRR